MLIQRLSRSLVRVEMIFFLSFWSIFSLPLSPFPGNSIPIIKLLSVKLINCTSVLCIWVKVKSYLHVRVKSLPNYWSYILYPSFNFALHWSSVFRYKMWSSLNKVFGQRSRSYRLSRSLWIPILDHNFPPLRQILCRYL